MGYLELANPATAIPLRTKVYVAGPYTNPDPCANTHRAVHTGQLLLNAGYSPFIPHLTHFWHTMIPNPYQVWLDYDMEWLLACDVVLRLPGESSGADKELAMAKQAGIPIAYSLDEVLTKHPHKRP